MIECISYINTHLHETIAVSDLAELVKLNASYLSVLFKRQVGTSISEYVITKRIRTAENMLRLSDFSLSEISDILHFSSYSHFARTFRKHYHTSPKRYRDMHYQSMQLLNQ